MSTNNKATSKGNASFPISNFLILSDNLPGWTTFPVKSFQEGFKSCKSVLLGDYLIVLAHDFSTAPDDRESDDNHSHNNCSEQEFSSDSGWGPENSEPPVLLAIDLRDNSVQEVPLGGFAYREDYTFTKYKENQIIVFGGEQGYQKLRDLSRITITSFRRMLYL